MSPFAVAATLWFWLVFLVTSPICLALGTVLWLVTLPFDADKRALHWFVTRWTFQYLRAWPGWSVRVRGREHLPKEPCVLVANHQSMADVVAVMGIRYPFKFVSKASLFSLPIVGWLMRMMKYVSLERGRHGSTRAMMDVCRFWLRCGMSVLIFPEGTYSTEKMLPFKRGAFVLAVEEKVPVVPVVLRGTDGLIRGDGPWMNARARIVVEVLPAISADAFNGDVAALSDHVRAQFLAREELQAGERGTR